MGHQITAVRFSQPAKKRILIVNCYFDDSRRSVARPAKFPKAMAPVYLAGACDPSLCEVRLHNEVDSGPLLDAQLLAWPDMLVLTGLTNVFDRMLQLTAYVRTKNPHVVVVAGGPSIRALPHLASRYFDYCCSGDIEQFKEILADSFGKAYVSDEMIPRYDLAYWAGSLGLGYAETTRYCNFSCSFCALTGEGRKYQKYDLEYIRQQFVAMGKKRRVLFLDNNFYGNDRNNFLARLELLHELRREGYFKTWSALVTNDFFRNEENLKLAKEAGCEVLFSGVESFDAGWLRSVKKLQNTCAPQVEMIRSCLDAGILFIYGLMLDVTSRSVEDLRRELSYIVETPEITLPSFCTLPIPILGTPFFFECLKRGAILPHTKLRDMDGSTLTLQPHDSMEQVVQFLQDMLSMRGYKWRVLRHELSFLRRYGSNLSPAQHFIELTNVGLLCAYSLATAPTRLGTPSAKGVHRTYISTNEILDPVYVPSFRVDARFENYFKPIMITDARGHLSEDISDSGLLKMQKVKRLSVEKPDLEQVS